MKKLKLELHSLRVESFETLMLGPEQSGTIEAYTGAIQPGTCDTGDVYCATMKTCVDTCDHSCANTCPATCANTCQYSCTVVNTAIGCGPIFWTDPESGC